MSITAPGESADSPPMDDPPHLTLDDPHYPRPKWITRICKVLRLSWLAFIFYLSIVIPTLVTNALSGTVGVKDVLAALLVYGPLQSQPLLVSGCLAAAGLFVLAGRWADRDLKRAQAVSLAHESYERQQRDYAYRQRQLDIAVQKVREAASDAPTEYGPPFDFDRIPVPQHLVGRVQENAWLLSRLGGDDASIPPNLVTALSGMDGIGKTTLAGLAARDLRKSGRFPDGIAVVRCENLESSAVVLAQTMACFHRNRRMPRVTTTAQLAEAARASLRGKNALIVLDNVEPTLNLSEVVMPLQDAGTPVLLTAWQTLDEHVVPHTANHRVTELSEGDALELFAQMYGLARAADLTESDRTTAEHILALVRYHTFSISVTAAAARQEGRPLSALAAELEKGLRDILEFRGDRQHRAMSVIIGQSTKYLENPERRLLTALAAFGTVECGRNAVVALSKALGITPPNAAIHQLIGRNLLETGQPDAAVRSGDSERLRLHPLLRAYVEEEFQRTFSDEHQQLAYGAVATYYADYVTHVQPSVQALDAGNIVAALEWAHAHDRNDIVMALTAAMARFWSERWRTTEALRYFPWGIAAAQAFAGASGAREDQKRVADLELAFGQILQNIGRLDDANAMLSTNLDIRRRLGDREGEGKVALQLGELAMLRGQPLGAREHFKDVLSVFSGLETSSSKESIETVLCYLGELEVMAGHLASGMTHFERSLALSRERSDGQGESTLLAYEGDIALLQGDEERARRLYDRSLQLAQQWGDSRGEADCLAKLGNMALTYRRLDEAESYYQCAYDICQSVQDRPGLSAVYSLMARALQARGRLDEASQYYGKSMKIAREIQSRRREGIINADKGRLAQARGDLDEAMLLYRQSVNLSAYVGDFMTVAKTAVTLGELLAAHPERVGQGCATLVRTLQLCEGTDLPDTQKGLAIARQLGCLEGERGSREPLA